jgi:isopentenyl diphosphate isomerase/L-lactate dehydrogenase-like FMN-dependent dehydrogenase
MGHDTPPGGPSKWRGVRDFLGMLSRDMTAGARRLSDVRPGSRLARRIERCTTIEDLRQAARRSTPRVVFDFVDGAANDEVTLAANQADFRSLRLLPRTLVDVGHIATETEVLGTRVSLPLLGAPTGLTGLAHHEGEVGIARAVHAAGSLYVVSAMASYSLEEVRAATDGTLWFQLYAWRDRGFVRSLIERARAIGCLALVLTVDVPLAGARERDARNGFGIPPRMSARSLAQGLTRPRWSRDFVLRPRIEVANAAAHGAVARDAVSLLQYINTQFNPSLTWSDLQWIREAWDGRIVVKGVLRADDAAKAVEIGADAVVVSNHGGRQLDGASSSIAALPAVMQAVGDRAEVYLDGGIRRGGDILKALALGARACLAGRPLVYGLAAGGQAGTARVMAILEDELRVAMALSGCPDLSAVSEDLLAFSPASIPIPSIPTPS